LSESKNETQSVTISHSARRYALGVLVVVYTFNFIDRQILAILLPAIKAEFLVDDWVLGFLAGSAFALFYATLGVPIATLADRWNRRNLIAIAVAIALVGAFFISRIEPDPKAEKSQHFYTVERVFSVLMVVTACGMAFAHGSNDVANGIGPLAAVVSIIQSGGEVTQKAALPLWILVLGGTGIVVGLSTMGYRVMKTIGSGITQLTPSRGYCATLAAAATVVLASRTGLPVSTTHIAVGAVIGVGLARGVGAIDLRVIGGIIVSWVVTLPVGAALAALFFFTLKGMFT